ncbi:MAG: hypothetical protein CMP11_06945 [Zetaproteobacteria bacterium]|mgnify:CR=1 FL=1|nr:hypothetical protein [Pseudobdellovibrionaceae bacterium]|tara:strand:+ start:432 stop:989 length:558 start_codon:yes stop_codon:yes gene_type:complete
MKHLVVFLYIIIFSYTQNIYCNSPKQISFNPRSQPHKNDWKFFNETTAQWKINFWNHYIRENFKFNNWSWKWKIAWLNACKNENLPFCSEILIKSLENKAHIIRKHAISISPDNFRISLDSNIIVKLEDIYLLLNSRNINHQVLQKEILLSLWRISTEASLSAGKILAAKSSFSQDYWQKLQKKY